MCVIIVANLLEVAFEMKAKQIPRIDIHDRMELKKCIAVADTLCHLY